METVSKELVVLTKEWNEEEANIQGLENQLKMRKKIKQDVEKRIIEYMDNEGISSAKIDNETFALKETLYSSINKEDTDAAKQFFGEKGMLQEVVREEWQKGRLNEITKDLLKLGSLPDWLKYYIKRYISSREAKKDE